MRQADEIDLDSLDGFSLTRLVTLLEGNSVDLRQDLDPQRRHAEADELAPCQKCLRRLLGNGEAKLSQGLDEGIHIARMSGDPYVHIARGAGIPIIADGVAAHHQVLNSMAVEQL